MLLSRWFLQRCLVPNSYPGRHSCKACWCFRSLLICSGPPYSPGNYQNLSNVLPQVWMPGWNRRKRPLLSTLSWVPFPHDWGQQSLSSSRILSRLTSLPCLHPTQVLSHCVFSELSCSRKPGLHVPGKTSLWACQASLAKGGQWFLAQVRIYESCPLSLLNCHSWRKKWRSCPEILSQTPSPSSQQPTCIFVLNFLVYLVFHIRWQSTPCLFPPGRLTFSQKGFQTNYETRKVEHPARQLPEKTFSCLEHCHCLHYCTNIC